MENRHIKLFVVIYSLARGGAERVAVEMARAWSQRGVEVTLVTLASDETDFFATPPGVERVALGLTSDHGNLLRRLRLAALRVFALRRLLRERRPDATVGFMVAAAVLLGIAGCGLPGRRIGSERTYPPMVPLGAPGEIVRALAYGLLHSVVGQTRDCAAWLKARTFTRRVGAIPNSVIMPLPAHEPHVAVTDHIGEGDLILLAVGRFGPEKQFEQLVRTFASIADRHPQWRLAIAGGGDLHAAVARLAASPNLAERVILPGPVGNMADWYGRASAYVMTSSFEGFPNSLLEAMAFGLPVAAFDCKTGPSDMIDHRHNGLLVPPQNFDALAEALDALLANEGERRRLGKSALGVRERFAEKAVIGLWAEQMGPGFVRLTEADSGVGEPSETEHAHISDRTAGRRPANPLEA